MKSLVFTMFLMLFGFAVGVTAIDVLFQQLTYRDEVELQSEELAGGIADAILYAHSLSNKPLEEVAEGVLTRLQSAEELAGFSVLDQERTAEQLGEGQRSKVLSSYVDDAVDIIEVLIALPDGRGLYFKFVDRYSDQYMGAYYASLGVAMLLGLLIVFASSYYLYRYLRQLRLTSHTIAEGDYSARAPRSSIEALSQLSKDVDNMAIALAANHERQEVFNTALHHETRIPLQRMRLALDMARSCKDYGDLDSLLLDLDGDLEELTQIAEEMLVLSRLRFNPDSLLSETLLLREVVEDVVREQRCIDNVEVVGDESCQLTINRTLVAVVARNLIGNANKFCQQLVRVSVDSTGQWVTLCVEDDGPGIDSDKRQKVFEPFVQASGENSEEQGVGIGLALVKQIAAYTQGDISVGESELSGASITVRWPNQRPGGKL